jgi:lysosomal acid lipase/cholesteryl ester hydrolase
LETHEVKTADGYYLGLFRIPGALAEKKNSDVKKPAVLMHAALDCDMMEFVYNKPEDAPAFILARAGYDVWLGNNRGTKYSQKHETLSPKKREFWQFGWDEMGLYDTPAEMDYIIANTGLEKINYIGHSQGTTQIMAAGSLIPEYYK